MKSVHFICCENSFRSRLTEVCFLSKQLSDVTIPSTLSINYRLILTKEQQALLSRCVENLKLYSY